MESNISPCPLQYIWREGCGMSKNKITRLNKELKANHLASIERDKEYAASEKLKAVFRSENPSNQPCLFPELVSDLFKEIECLKKEIAEHLESEHDLSVRHPVDIGYKYNMNYW